MRERLAVEDERLALRERVVDVEVLRRDEVRVEVELAEVPARSLRTVSDNPRARVVQEGTHQIIPPRADIAIGLSYIARMFSGILASSSPSSSTTISSASSSSPLGLGLNSFLSSSFVSSGLKNSVPLLSAVHWQSTESELRSMRRVETLRLPFSWMISLGLSCRMRVSIWVRDASSSKALRENSAVEASRTHTPNEGGQAAEGMFSCTGERKRARGQRGMQGRRGGGGGGEP